MRYLFLDFETRSRVDLKKVGAWVYANHPSTEIICAAWDVNYLVTRTASINDKFGEGWKVLSRELERADFIVAHNAFFEQVITEFVLGIKIPPEKWICTASMAATHALPRSLEGACQALNLPIQKDMEGHRLMLKMCKPRRPTKTNKNEWVDDPESVSRLVQYCKKDVEAEIALFRALPMLPPNERKIWLLDQKINHRGIRVDRQLVKTALELVQKETENLKKQTAIASKGKIESATQRDAVLKWINDFGAELRDVRAKTISDALKRTNIHPAARQMLELRQASSKSSTAKYKALEMRSSVDGRIHDLIVYHGASTGRWTGSGAQLQNLPKVTLQNTDLAAEIVLTKDLDFIRQIYGNPMPILSSLIRGTITATPGFELFRADYSSIEARKLFWFADHVDGLNAYRGGRDLYKEMAAFIFGKEISEITPDERWLGKSTILGAGYSMSWKKFKITCENQGRQITDQMAKKAVYGYREKHAPVVALWKNIEQAAKEAIRNKVRVKVNHTEWYCDDWFLYCVLPSGRKLAYCGPTVRQIETNYGDVRPTIYHWGVNPVSKKWENAPTFGARLVENLVQASSRDIMAEAMLRIDRAGFNVVLSVHDEILAEAKSGTKTYAEFLKLMTVLPEWAKGVPLAAEGGIGFRYQK